VQPCLQYSFMNCGVVGILSPSNKAETWANVWSYVTIPSVWEILVLHTAHIRADLLRREDDGT
jgi:hypothetical protein